LVIWAVGSILGVTKDVDIVFTRRFDISRVQVLVMNPNLIAQSVNVVISENLYELKFRVELAGETSNPQPMKMDHFNEDGSDHHEESGRGTGNQGSKQVPKSGDGDAGPKVGTKTDNEKGSGAEQVAKRKQATFVL
jgi:hypothetical protein